MKKSLNHESDELYASWQHGMDKRKPDFQKFRLRSKREIDRYLGGLARNENQAPAG